MPRLKIRLLATAAAVFVTAVAAYGQNPQFSALYQGADPKGDFSFIWKEKGGNFTRPVGRLRWEVPPSEFSTGGMDRSFTGFCSEPLVPIVAGNLYRYEVQSPEIPEIYGLPNNDDGVRAASRRAKYVRELFGKHYLNALKADDNVTPLAFQAALWEIVHESEFPDVPAPFNLFTGNFRANYPNVEQSPPYIQQAQSYLTAMTGDDLATFYDNTAIAGRELVHMKGLVNAENGLVAQSQFGLRDPGAGGGVPGFNGGTATPGNGAMGGGFGGGGFGGGNGFGGPGIFAGGNGSGGGSGGGGNNFTNSTPPSSQNPNTPGGGPSTNPPPTTGGGPPTEQPDNPGGGNNPVPAPAGALLGVIAIGVLAGRRAIARVHHKS